MSHEVPQFLQSPHESRPTYHRFEVTTKQVIPCINLHPLAQLTYDVAKLYPTTDQKCEKRPHHVANPHIPRSRLSDRFSQSISLPRGQCSDTASQIAFNLVILPPVKCLPHQTHLQQSTWRRDPD